MGTPQHQQRPAGKIRKNIPRIKQHKNGKPKSFHTVDFHRQHDIRLFPWHVLFHCGQQKCKDSIRPRHSRDFHACHHPAHQLSSSDIRAARRRSYMAQPRFRRSRSKLPVADSVHRRNRLHDTTCGNGCREVRSSTIFVARHIPAADSREHRYATSPEAIRMSTFRHWRNSSGHPCTYMRNRNLPP